MAVLNNITENGKFLKEEVGGAQNDINKIWNNAIKTRGYLTEEEYVTIQGLLTKIRELTNSQMSKTQADIEIFKRNAGDKNFQFDKDTTNRYIQLLKDNKKEQLNILKEAQQQAYIDADSNYKVTLARLIKAGKDQVTAEREAGKLRNEARSAADKTYKEGVEGLDKEYLKNKEWLRGELIKSWTKLKDDNSKGAVEARNQISDALMALDSTRIAKVFQNAGIKSINAFSDGVKSKSINIPVRFTPKDGATQTIGTLKAYASGGFPDMGQMFIAREAGPELVGTIGGRTAVANNDQIVEAIKQGVVEAMMMANSREQSVNVYSTLKLDNETVYRGQQAYVANNGMTFNDGRFR